MLPKTLKRCQKSKKSPNLVTLVRYCNVTGVWYCNATSDCYWWHWNRVFAILIHVIHGKVCRACLTFSQSNTSLSVHNGGAESLKYSGKFPVVESIPGLCMGTSSLGSSRGGALSVVLAERSRQIRRCLDDAISGFRSSRGGALSVKSGKTGGGVGPVSLGSSNCRGTSVAKLFFALTDSTILYGPIVMLV